MEPQKQPSCSKPEKLPHEELREEPPPQREEEAAAALLPSLLLSTSLSSSSASASSSTRQTPILVTPDLPQIPELKHSHLSVDPSPPISSLPIVVATESPAESPTSIIFVSSNPMSCSPASSASSFDKNELPSAFATSNPIYTSAIDIAATLRRRLAYAAFKVKNGWQNDTIETVARKTDDLYSKLRSVKKVFPCGKSIKPKEFCKQSTKSRHPSCSSRRKKSGKLIKPNQGDANISPIRADFDLSVDETKLNDTVGEIDFADSKTKGVRQSEKSPSDSPCSSVSTVPDESVAVTTTPFPMPNTKKVVALPKTLLPPKLGTFYVDSSSSRRYYLNQSDRTDFCQLPTFSQKQSSFESLNEDKTRFSSVPQNLSQRLSTECDFSFPDMSGRLLSSTVREAALTSLQTVEKDFNNSHIYIDQTPKNNGEITNNHVTSTVGSEIGMKNFYAGKNSSRSSLNSQSITQSTVFQCYPKHYLSSMRTGAQALQQISRTRAAISDTAAPFYNVFHQQHSHHFDQPQAQHRRQAQPWQQYSMSPSLPDDISLPQQQKSNSNAGVSANMCTPVSQFALNSQIHAAIPTIAPAAATNNSRFSTAAAIAPRLVHFEAYRQWQNWRQLSAYPVQKSADVENDSEKFTGLINLPHNFGQVGSYPKSLG